MLSYLLIYFIDVFLAWLNNVIKTKNNFFMKLSLLFLIIISGLRWEVGIDYLSYLLIFQKIKIGDYSLGKEIGYTFLNKIFCLFDLPFNIMLTFIAIVNTLLFYKFIKFFSTNKKNYYIYIFIYLFFTVYYFSLSGIRQGIAIHLLLYSLIFIYKNQLKKSSFIILIGIFFHKSILLLYGYTIILYKIKNKKLKTLIYLFGTIMLLVLSVNTKNTIVLKLLETLNFEEYIQFVRFEKVEIRILFILKILIFILVLILYNLKNSKKIEFLLEILLQYFFLICIGLVGIPLFKRLLIYYTGITIFLPEIIIKKLKIKREIVIFLTLFYGYFYYVKYYNYANESIKNAIMENKFPAGFERFNNKYRTIIMKGDYRNKELYIDKDGFIKWKKK